MSLPLHAQIESILFYKTEPLTLKWLGDFLSVSPEEITTALDQLRSSLEGHGLALIEDNGAVVLGTHPETSSLIERLHVKEITSELSRSALETLSIILYRGSATKADLDYIRGVNSQFMLRNLLIRGLIQKEVDAHDKRRPRYHVTHDTLSFLGVTDRSQLPGYDEYIKTIETLLQTQPAESTESRELTEQVSP
jgi:segregation and condensation protein B